METKNKLKPKTGAGFSWRHATTTAMLLLITAFGTFESGEVLASEPTGYVTDSAGEVVKNRFDECWRTSAWSPEIAIEECDPDLVKKPEPAPEPKVVDSDGDGVPDSRDACPGTPAGVEVDSRGCPIDTDGDGVPDYKDKCPNTAAGTEVDADGCPIVGTTIFTIEGVNFAFDSAKLLPEAKSTLDSAIRTLRDNRNVSVAIIGHTDSTGPAAYNQGLSERRAKSVHTYLLNNGIDSSNRLSVSGRGENDPVASNDTKAGRAQNRRVEFVVE